jgi:hypothetical protein
LFQQAKEAQDHQSRDELVNMGTRTMDTKTKYLVAKRGGNLGFNEKNLEFAFQKKTVLTITKSSLNPRDPFDDTT